MSESVHEDETLGSQDTSYHYSDYDEEGEDDDVSTMSRASSGVGSISGRMGSLHVATDMDSAADGMPPAEELLSKSGASSSSKKDRVHLNLNRSDLYRFFHCMNPESQTYGSDEVAWISLKLQASLINNGVSIDIAETGRNALAKFDVPKALQVPSNLLGSELNDDHVLHQSVQQEVDSRRAREDMKDTAVIGMKIPFKAETSTSDDLFGENSGQSTGFCSVVKKERGEAVHPADVTSNTVFVFKKQGNAFGVKTSVSTRLFSPSSETRPPAAPAASTPVGTAETTGTHGAAPSSAMSVRSNRSRRTHNAGLSILSGGARSLAIAADEIPMNIDAGMDNVSSHTRRSKRKKDEAEEKTDV